MRPITSAAPTEKTQRSNSTVNCDVQFELAYSSTSRLLAQISELDLPNAKVDTQTYNVLNYTPKDYTCQHPNTLYKGMISLFDSFLS
uniref:Uncharacterized protein n=1 Tax=Octopus bimaculoides TaxID=37653 RepID=A0A0L8I6U4_OCTBM